MAIAHEVLFIDPTDKPGNKRGGRSKCRLSIQKRKIPPKLGISPSLLPGRTGRLAQQPVDRGLWNDFIHNNR